LFVFGKGLGQVVELYVTIATINRHSAAGSESYLKHLLSIRALDTCDTMILGYDTIVSGSLIIYSD